MYLKKNAFGKFPSWNQGYNSTAEPQIANLITLSPTELTILHNFYLAKIFVSCKLKSGNVADESSNLENS